MDQIFIHLHIAYDPCPQWKLSAIAHDILVDVLKIYVSQYSFLFGMARFVVQLMHNVMLPIDQIVHMHPCGLISNRAWTLNIYELKRGLPNMYYPLTVSVELELGFS